MEKKHRFYNSIFTQAILIVIGFTLVALVLSGYFFQQSIRMIAHNCFATLRYREFTPNFFDIIKFSAVPELEPDTADNAEIILGHVIDNAHQGRGISMLFQGNRCDALSERKVT